MGTWTLESVNGVSRPLDNPTYGTNFHAHFKLKYTPAALQNYAETPKLDWHERILMKEHHKGECWEFETNMYAHNPCSKTLLIWARRYIEAYNAAAGRAYNGKGSSTLLDTSGQPVKMDSLEPNLAGDADKADAVRTYLKKHGGYLQIEIHDIPSINVPKGNEHKERLLTFDCGLEGGQLRLRAEQYLDVDGTARPTEWKRDFKMKSGTAWNVNGLRKVAAPAMVSNPRGAIFTAGECW